MTRLAELIGKAKRAITRDGQTVSQKLETAQYAALLFTMAIAGAAWPWRHVIFLICAIYFLIRGWLWLCRRHPLVAWFVFGFVEGLLGSGRRRRR